MADPSLQDIDAELARRASGAAEPSVDEIDAELARRDKTPPKKETGSSTANALKFGTREAVMGAASLPLAALDSVTALANMVPATVNKIAGTEIPGLPYPSAAMERAFTSAGFPEAETTGEKYLGAGIRGAASVPGTVGAIAKIPAAAKSAWGALKEGLSAQPVSQVITGTGAGVGAEAGKDVAPDSKVAPFIGGMTGALSTAGLLGGAKYVGKSIYDAVEPLFAKGQQKIAGRALLANTSDPETLIPRIEQGQTPLIPGSMPTTAEAARDPGLAALERGAKQGSTVTASDFALREADRNAARQRHLATIESGAGGAEDVALIARQRRDAIQADTARVLGSARAEAARRIAAMGDNTSPEAAGAVMRAEFGTAYEEARTIVDRAYRQVDPSGTTTIPVSPLAIEAGEVVHGYYGNAPSGVPTSLSPILERLAETRNRTMTVAQLDGISKEASNIAGQAGRTGDRTLSAAAGRIAGLARDHIDDAAARVIGIDQQTADALRNARALRSDQGSRFETGASKSLSTPGQYGAPSTVDSAAPAAFLKRGKGSPEAMNQFVLSMGNRPAAVTALRNHAATELRDYATTPDGTFNPERFKKWMADREGALSQFPDVLKDFNSAGSAARTVERLTEWSAKTQEAFEKSALGYFLGRDPESAVSALMKNANSEALIKEAMLQMRGDKAAITGFRRAIRNLAVDGSTTTALDARMSPVLSTAKFVNFVTDHEKALRHVFAPDHLKAMQTVAADMQSQQWVAGAARTAGSNTAQNTSVVSVLQALPRAARSGIVGSILRAVAQPLLTASDDAIQKLIGEALLNPETAKGLASKASPVAVRKWTTVLADRLAAAGAGTMSGRASADEMPVEDRVRAKLDELSQSTVTGAP